MSGSAIEADDETMRKQVIRVLEEAVAGLRKAGDCRVQSVGVTYEPNWVRLAETSRALSVTDGEITTDCEVRHESGLVVSFRVKRPMWRRRFAAPGWKR